MADYMCPAMGGSQDITALIYGYQVQQLLTTYYNNVPVNASFFSDLPNADMMASNGMTIAENMVTNVEGLTKQANLATEAIKMELSALSPSSMPTGCQFIYPPAPNGTAHLMNAFYIEATLCGAFIGLADYLQAPTYNFLSARLAAEHGIHASAIRASMQAVGFMPNSTSLTPAFTPEMVLQPGMEVGMLGTWINKCNIETPMAPCGGSVTIGDLNAMLDGQSSMMDGGVMCSTVASASALYTATDAAAMTSPAMYVPPTETAAGAGGGTITTAPIATFTGEGSRLTRAGVAVSLMAVVMGWMMS